MQPSSAGAFPLLWTVIWFLLVSETPAEDKFISETERHYLIIMNKRYSSHKKVKYLPYLFLLLRLTIRKKSTKSKNLVFYFEKKKE